ncbi:MAG: CHASE2 domain-containing protein [Proteobacteria bacterium]|nr:CHASE2 domain-containing protein [Pseudomonadota bacterium]MCP4920061.1 CHASE2 domain-containing protein [Pseudomonadota bacterium]
MAYETAVVGFTALAVAVLVFLVSRGQFEDLYVKARGVAPPSDQVTLVSIGEEALYLWEPHAEDRTVTPRALLAQVVRFCEAAGAEVVVLDVLLDQPAEGDAALLSAAQAFSGTVIAAERFVETEPKSGARFQAGIADGFGGAISGGFANLQVEEPWLFSDAQLVRRAPLVAEVSRARMSAIWPLNIIGAEQAEDYLAPSMTLLAAVSLAHPDDALARIQAGDLDLPALPTPVEEPLLINFRGPERADPIPTIRAASILRAMGQTALAQEMGVDMPVVVSDELRGLLEGRVVVVGRVDAQADDRFVTPYAWPLLVDHDMAGVRVQAHVIDSLLSGEHIRVISRPLWILGVLLGAAVLVSRRFLRDDVHVIGWILVSGLLVAVGVLTFRWTDGLALDAGPPVGGILIPLVCTHVWEWAVDESRRT